MLRADRTSGGRRRLLIASAVSAATAAATRGLQAHNHFETIETLANPYGLIGRAVLEQMKPA